MQYNIVLGSSKELSCTTVGLVQVCWLLVISGVERACFPTLSEIYPSTHKHSFLSDTPRDLNRTLPSYELIAWPLLRLLYYRKDWILACYSQCLIERYRNCTIITLGKNRLLIHFVLKITNQIYQRSKH